MARTESTSSPLLWIGGVLLAAGALIVGGLWVYAITATEDMSVLLLVAFAAGLIGSAVLLIAALRDRIIHKKEENFLEVDN